MEVSTNSNCAVTTKQRRVLILYYSFSSQTRNLLYAFAKGLSTSGVEVFWYQIRPLKNLHFPLGSVAETLKMMVTSFFRLRLPIFPPADDVCDGYDLIVLAGPTWSYNPSGPVLSFFDMKASCFRGKRVVPFISCRGYWRMHYWQLRVMLRRTGADVLGSIIFRHLGPEPWRTVGVFLKLIGRNPESGRSWFRKYYRKFGHTKEQLDYAVRLGCRYGQAIRKEDYGFLRHRNLVGEVGDKII